MTTEFDVLDSLAREVENAQLGTRIRVHVRDLDEEVTSIYVSEDGTIVLVCD